MDLLPQPGKRLLRSLMGADPQVFVSLGLSDCLFLEEELPIFEYLREHLNAHGVLAEYQTVQSLFGVELPDAPEPPAFYLKFVEYRYLHSALRKVLGEASDLLGLRQAEDAHALLASAVSELTLRSHSGNLIDFIEVGESILHDSMNKLLAGNTVKTGWPTLDEMAGGLSGGDLVVIAGRPACLAGSTIVRFLQGDCGLQGTSCSLEEFYSVFHSGIAGKTRIQCLMSNDSIGFNEVLQVVRSGVKVTYTVVTNTSRTIRATGDHRFLTPSGYVRLGDLGLGSAIVCKSKTSLGGVSGIHQERIVSISLFGEEETFDVSCADPHNNFVADGFVVHNSGKAQPLDSRVKTITGWKRMGDIQVGDVLASVDGCPSVVTAIHPQGVLKTYTVRFQDGRAAECCADHLWEVMYRAWKAPRVVKTSQLVEMLAFKSYSKFLSVRLVSGDFGHSDDLPIDPWLLGYLIGNGCFRSSSPMVSFADPEVGDRIGKTLPGGYALVYRSKYDYSITNPSCVKGNGLVTALKGLGLWGHKSIDKFIPEPYLLSDKPRRLELLRGLMDSDGWVESGSPCYATSSRRLAHDFQSLVWSLGGVTSIGTKKTTHNDAYIFNVQIEYPNECFWLPRKRDITRAEHVHMGKPVERRLGLRAITESRSVECRCISVSHPSKLYVTDNYIVTHNTYCTLSIALNAWDVQKKSVLFVSMEMKPALIVQRLAAMYAKIPITPLKKGDLSERFMKVLGNAFIEGEDNPPFWIMDGALASKVSDISLLARQLNPDFIVIDGAYLVSPSFKANSSWERVKVVVEDIKRLLAEGMNIPVLASYQLNRDAAKVKKEESLGVETLAGSDAIGQIASVVLAMKELETVANLNKKKVEVIKGRSGECGSFWIEWVFDKKGPNGYMSFAEVVSLANQLPEDLPSVDLSCI